MTPIILDNKKVHDYIVQKDLLVTEGRKISYEIEKLETKIQGYEKKEMAITGNVKPPPEMVEKGDALTKEINKLGEALTKLSDEITRAKLAAIPKEMEEAHKALMKEKEEKERARNKIALKVQKLKDKLIPIVQKEVIPLLIDPYDDVETAKAKDGKVVITTFNHLEEWKKKFPRRR